jgi:hypothetical protein
MTTATDARASEPVGSTETAGDTPAAARVHSAGDHATAAQRPPPTEAEIRERVTAALAAGRHRIDIGEWVYDLSEPIHSDQNGDTGVWADLRPSEADELADLVETIYARADEIERTAIASITDMVVEAALAFAAAHPEAQRAPTREPVPA